MFLLAALLIYKVGWSSIYPIIKRSPLVFPVTLIVIAAIVGVFYSPDPYRAKSKLALLLSIYGLFFLSLSIPFDSRDRKILCLGIGFGALTAALLALYEQWLGHADSIDTLRQYSVYDETMQREIIRSLEANRALGRFGNPNHLAGYLVLALWPVWMLWKKVKRKAYRAGLVLIGVVLMVGVYRTFSRSGLVVLLLSIFLFLSYEYLIRGKKFPWKTIVAIVVILIGILFCAVVMTKGNVFGGRLLTNSTILARLDFYRGGLHIIEDYPWFGVGTEGYEGYFCAYLRPGDFEARYVHNSVIEVAVEWGIIGCFLFFWLICAALRYVRIQWNLENQEKTIVFSAFGTGLVLFLLSLIDFHNNLTEMWIVPALFFGLAGQNPDDSPQNDSTSMNFCKYGILIILFCAWIVLIGARFVNETYRENGYYLLIDNKPVAAMQAYEKAVLFDRTDADSWGSLGGIYLNLPTIGSNQKALDCYARAVQYAPRRASHHANYAEALFRLGYTERAIAEMKTALQLFPARAKYHEQLADYYDLLNEPKKAETERQIAERIQRQIEEKRT